MGALVESAGVIGLACKSDAADAGGCIVEGDGAIATLEDRFKFIAEGGGAGDVPAVIHMHVQGEGVGWVDGAAFVEAVVVRGGWEETPVGEESDKVFVILMVGLFYTVTASSDFGDLASEGAGEVGGKGGDELVAIGHSAGKLVMEKCSWEVEVTEEESVKAVAVRGIGEVTAEDEGAVGCIGGAGVSVVI